MALGCFCAFNSFRVSGVGWWLPLKSNPTPLYPLDKGSSLLKLFSSSDLMKYMILFNLWILRQVIIVKPIARDFVFI
jgi:hypothetical protein